MEKEGFRRLVTETCSSAWLNSAWGLHWAIQDQPLYSVTSNLEPDGCAVQTAAFPLSPACLSRGNPFGDVGSSISLLVTVLLIYEDILNCTQVLFCSFCHRAPFSLDQRFSTCGLQTLWGSKDPFTGAAYHTSCISDSRIIIHNISKVTVIK
jgi:hypothetical protein